MKYKAYINQGQGCDYTIACGVDIIDLEASSMEEAKKALIKEIKEEYTGERALASAQIFEINDIFAVNMKTLMSEIEEAEIEIERKKREEDERREFERLKKKFS